MRTSKLAVVLGGLVLLVTGCSESKNCKPETVFATIACPEGFASGTFEVYVSRDGGQPTKVSPDLTATCPQTTLQLNLN